MLDTLQRIVLLWKNKKNYYKSPIHKTLDECDSKHPLSQSQTHEYLKHFQIHTKRDDPSDKLKSPHTWLDQDDIQ